MTSLCNGIRYLDVRNAETSDLISLDLTRHLPRRLAIGPAIIINKQPELLPVIRKRWMRIVREVQKQYSCTLNRSKKLELVQEISRMRSYIFSTKLNKKHADVIVIEPHKATCDLPNFASFYITSPLTAGQFLAAAPSAMSNSVVAIYDDNQKVYEQALVEMYLQQSQYNQDHAHSHTK